MQTISADPEPAHAWRRARRCLERVRDWITNGNCAYSPLLSLSLLLAFGLFMQISR
jgi:hypothetical protein